MFMNFSSRRVQIIILSVTLLLLSLSMLLAQTWTKELAGGVTLKQMVKNSGKPEVITALYIAPAFSGVRIQAVLAKDVVYQDNPSKGCETVSSMAGRLKAIAAVNSDFFPMGGDVPGDPLNLMVINGELVSEPSQRVILGITKDGKPVLDNATYEFSIKVKDGKSFPLRGINRRRGGNELVLFTDKYSASTGSSADGCEAIIKLDNLPLRVGEANTGTVTEVRAGAGDTPLTPGVLVLSGQGTGAKYITDNLSVGTQVSLSLVVRGQRIGSWEKIKEAVGGGCWIVRDGKVFLNHRAEGFGESFSTISHPRTAAGITKDGKLVLVTVDGRQSISGGMPLSQLAKLMLSLGCVQAANLDGGGSTTMAAYYGILNSPSSGIERQVANGVAVFADEKPVEEVEFSIAPIAKVLSGTSVKLTLMDASGEKPLDASTAAKVIWATRGGAGFIDQSGTFYGVKARRGEVIAKLGTRVVSVPVETIAGVPQSISARLKADESAPNRGTLTISVLDVNTNYIGNARLVVRITGGVADEQLVETGSNGTAETGITWEGTPESYVVVTCGGQSVKVMRATK